MRGEGRKLLEAVKGLKHQGSPVGPNRKHLPDLLIVRAKDFDNLKKLADDTLDEYTREYTRGSEAE